MPSPSRCLRCRAHHIPLIPHGPLPAPAGELFPTRCPCCPQVPGCPRPAAEPRPLRSSGGSGSSGARAAAGTRRRGSIPAPRPGGPTSESTYLVPDMLPRAADGSAASYCALRLAPAEAGRFRSAERPAGGGSWRGLAAGQGGSLPPAGVDDSGGTAPHMAGRPGVGGENSPAPATWHLADPVPDDWAMPCGDRLGRETDRVRSASSALPRLPTTPDSGSPPPGTGATVAACGTATWARWGRGVGQGRRWKTLIAFSVLSERGVCRAPSSRH